MKIYKIINLFLAATVLLLVSCEPNVDEAYLKNTTDVAGVELVATQSTTGGNEITLEMVTPGITGYWNYNLGKALTNKTTIIYPIPGTATFTYEGTLGAEFFSKTIDVQIDQLDHALDQDWYDLVSEDTAAGKTWVFDGVGGDNGLWWYMSSGGPDNDPKWDSVWWNAGGTCCPPGDVNGKMHFDLNGAANYTYFADAGGAGALGSFVLDVKNQMLYVSGQNILGGNNPGEGGYNPDGIYEIISLTEDELILFIPDAQWDSGWTWIFKPLED